MSLINVSNLTFGYDGSYDTIFEKVSFQLDTNWKLGFTGRNGKGKTTFLKLLMGQYEYSGTIAASVDFSYFPFKVEQRERNTIDVVDSLSGNYAFWELQRELSMLEVDYDVLYRPFSTLSEGEQTKVLLAVLFLRENQFLLIDEPTNHLDMASRELVGQYLNTKRGFILVSHDRYFLDQVTNRILEISHGKMYSYDANYTTFLELKAQREEMELASERKRQSILRMELEWAKRGCRARTTKQKARLERLESLKNGSAPVTDDTITLDSVETRMGKKTMELHHVSKSYGEKVLVRDFSYTVLKNQKLGIIGPNGCGKTTLLRILVGQTAPDEGSVSIGPRVQIGYYDQTQSDLNLDKTVFDEIADAYPKLGNTAVRNALGVFLFHGDDVFKRVRDLSGGERARVALVKLMLSQTNFLILDEPTNHLDIESKEVLENALLGYDGTLLVVSHDRYFINKLATKIYDLGQTGAVCYAGDYNYYLSKREEISVRKVEETPSKDKGASDYANRKAQQSLKRKQKARLLRLEEEIHQTEQQLTALQAELENPEIAGDYVILTEKTQQLNELSVQLDALYTEWTELSDVQEKACNGV